MYIAELFGECANIRYTYRNRGTKVPHFPTAEMATEGWLTPENGCLFQGKPILYGGYDMLDGGIDLVIDLRERCFVDHLALDLVGEIASLDILDGEGRLVAHACPAEATGAHTCTLSIGCYTDCLTLRFAACFANFGFKSIALLAAKGVEETVYPVPTSATYGEGVLPFGAIGGAVAEDPRAAGAIAYLAERFADELSHPLTISEGNVRFVYTPREDDGYTLSVTEAGVTVGAAYPRAFFYAAAALVQLATPEGLRHAEINDTPFMGIRGVHLSLPSRENIPFFYRLFRELLVPMRYNLVILQLSGAMQYECYPEINEAWQEAGRRYRAGEWPRPAHYGFVPQDVLTHGEVRAICDYIRSFGLEIAPEVQSLSHVQYVTAAFPELAERKPMTEAQDIDHATADIPPADFYPHNACPRHPKYYEVFFALIDEVIDVIRPERYLHIGHDEGYDIGKCPLCRGQATEVFVEEVRRLHDHISAHGLTTMMWSDMLHPGKSEYLVPDSAPLLPKDIVMLDFTWYFELPVDIEDRLLPHGYRVMIGNMYSSHYPRYETRSKKPGMIGAQVSTWTANEESLLAYRGKFYDLVYTATMMWNPVYDPSCRLTYTELVKRLLPAMRRRIGLLPERTATLPLAIGGKPANVPTALLYHSPAEVALRLSTTAPEAEIAVSKRAEYLEILHATDRPSLRPIWEPGIEIGEYRLVYEDGSEWAAPVRYGEHILTYRHRYGTPIPSPYYRHSGYSATYTTYPVEGKDAEGRDYTLLAYPIVNPYPEKVISRILCRHHGATDAEILVFEIKTN